MSIRCWRAHGLGNDYLVLAAGPALDPALAMALCDRHRGVGADGVLEPVESDRADHGVKIWNPDGSVAEKSGNGLRIYARWLAEHRHAPARFTIDTGHDVVTCAVGSHDVTVAMGRATVAPEAVPVVRRLVDEPLDLGDEIVRVIAVGVGNPHCVVFVDDPETTPVEELGPALENHVAFPQRTNVEFVAVRSPVLLEQRTWERGTGETLACGSGACATGVAAMLSGRSERDVEIVLRGGTLRIRWPDEEGPVWMTGPAAHVFDGALDYP